MPKAILTVRIPESLMTEIRECAKAHEKNLSEFARQVFEFYLNEDGTCDNPPSLTIREAEKERKIRNLRTKGRKP